jgi:hypothetical protein
MRPIYLVLAIAVSIAASGAESDLVLTPGGLGPVQVGMTIRQAEKALGAKLRVEKYSDDSGPDDCQYAFRADAKFPEVGYMLNARRIVRIDIEVPGYGPQHSPIRTAEGVGLGSTESAVKRAYGRTLKIEPHSYGGGEASSEPEWHYLVVDESDHKRGIIFETEGLKVTSFRAGKYPELGWIEGCS